MAKGLTAADRIGVGDVQDRVAGPHAITGGEALRQVAEAGCHVNAVEPDGLGYVKSDVYVADVAGDSDEVIVGQPQFLS